MKIRQLGMKWVVGLACVAILAISGCSRQQNDWDKTRTANNLESYEQFVKKYPSGDFTAQAQARVKELEEERDWQKARDADTPDAYQAFLKQYPEGKWTEEARIRIENFSLAQAPAGPDASPVVSSGAPAAGAAIIAGAEKPGAGPAAKAPASKPAPADRGKYAVQLAAYSAGKAAAEQGWSTLQARYSAQLKGLTHHVSSGKGPKGTVYRLQATGLSKSHAQSICKSLAAKSQACMVVAP